MMKDPFVIAFSVMAFLYVAVECSIYVWMPTLITGYDGSAIFIATYALPIFFILRAGGRFLGAWVVGRFNWTLVLCILCLLVMICFIASVTGGVHVAVIMLPLSGLFMSVIYPTINSKGISCLPKAKHGSVAGILLFFTAAGAALGPLAMGAVSDAFGHDLKYGFILATVFAVLLFIGSVVNLIYNPTVQRLSNLDKTEY
jgi:fucose permease